MARMFRENQRSSKAARADLLCRFAALRLAQPISASDAGVSWQAQAR
jgi:hypothetical protein